MQEKDTVSAGYGHTQGQPRPYSADELERLGELVKAGPLRYYAIRHLFPGRSRASLTKKAVDVRRALGIGSNIESREDRKPISVQALDPNDPGEDDDWEAKWAAHCKQANQTFVLALLQVA